MKILFVCRQNIGRSQMAAALFNQLQPGVASSAGTIVDLPGQTLEDCGAIKTIAAMKEIGIDVSGKTRRQLTPEMLQDYDKVIVMSEPENTPDWLSRSPNAQYWEIEDTKQMDLDGTRVIRDVLRARIADTFGLLQR